jgi:hypothetical protein
MADVRFVRAHEGSADEAMNLVIILQRWDTGAVEAPEAAASDYEASHYGGLNLLNISLG